MIALRFLGGAYVEVHGLAQSAVVTRRHPLALLALLARAPSHQLSRDRLAGWLWPNSAPHRARHRLRDTVYAVRRTLGTEAVLSIGDSLRLDAGRLQIDVLEFEAALAREALTDAVSLYAGPFLDGFFLTRNTSFERWAEAERIELAHAHHSALRRLAERAEDENLPREAAGWWRRLSREAPYDSDVAVGFMRALAAAGDEAGALQHAAAHAARLAEDLEAVPHERVRALTIQLEQPSPGTADPRVPGGEAAGASERVSMGAEGRRKSDGRRGTAGSHSGRHRLRWTALAAVSLAVAIGLARAVARTGAPVVDDQRVAVFPFEVHGQGPYAYLHKGLVDLLSIKLEVPGDTRTVDPRAVLSRAGRSRTPLDVAALARLSESLGAGTFVHGSIVQSDGEAQVIASLYSTEDPTPVVVADVSLSKEATLLEEMDKLSRQLLSGWLARDGDGYSSMAGRTTESLPAFKAYLAGERALRQGRFRESVARFIEATDLDPKFALAHYRTSVAANWVGLPELVRSGAEEAWKRREELPERAQRLLRARYLSYAGAFDIAETMRLLREIIADYPADVEARYELADLRFHNGWMWGLGDSEVREDFERVLTYDAQHPGALTHLVRLVVRQRDLRAMDTLVERGLTVVVDGRSRHELEALAAFARNSQPAQARVLEGLRDLDDESLFAIAAVTVTFSENLAGGARLAELLRQADRGPGARAFGLAWIAALEASQGRLEEARSLLGTAEVDPELSALVSLMVELTTPVSGNTRELEHARDRLAALQASAVSEGEPPDPFGGYATQANTLLLLSLASARLGDRAESHRYADELEHLPQLASEAEAWATLARSATALWSGDLEEALRLTNDVWLPSTQAPGGWQTFLRAKVLRATGAYEEALRWYAVVPSDYAFAPLFAASSHLRRAELYGQLGRQSEAAKHFERTAELWEQSDPEFHALLQEVRSRKE